MEENQIHIPEGWHLKQVQEFALKMRSGGTPKSDNPKFYNGEIPFVAIDDLTSANKYLIKTQKHITQEGLNNSAAWLVPVNTIMYSIYATLGVPRINLIEAATNQAILNIIPDERKITLEFLFYLLLEKRSSILAHSAHTTQSNLNAKIVKELEFVFPKNPNEQTQIATILSKVDEAITQTEQLIAKYSRIKTGLMQDLLTKGIDENGNIRSEETHEFKDSPLGRIPKEWEYCKMGVYIEANLYGPRFSANDYSENGNVKTIRGTDFSKSGEILYDQAPIAKLPPRMIKNHSLLNGDIVIVTTADCGLTAVFEQPENDLAFIPSAYSVKFRFKKEVYPYYLKLFMTTKFAASQVYKYVRQGTLGNLPGSDILNFDFVLPSNEEQYRIVNTIQKQEELIGCEKKELSKLQSLKTGLMQDLLSGKVRVNHLIKETASV